MEFGSLLSFLFFFGKKYAKQITSYILIDCAFYKHVTHDVQVRPPSAPYQRNQLRKVQSPFRSHLLPVLDKHGFESGIVCLCVCVFVRVH